MDAAADHDAALAGGSQRRGDQRSHRGEDDGRVQFLRGELLGVAGPDRPQAPGEFLGLGVARPGEGVDLPALVTATWTVMWAAAPKP